MKNLFAFILLFMVQFSFGQNNSILVSPDWLKDHLNDPGVVVLQVSFLKLDYEKEHIPGARFLWPGWLAPDSPEGSMNVPDLQEASTILSNMGISNNSHVILCHVRNEVSVTSRMFVMLEYLGLQGRVSFLNGGLDAWKKKGYEVSSTTPEVKKGKFKASINPVVVNSDYVLKNLESTKTEIVDARFQRYYDGEPTGYPRDGHIKGAKNIPYNEMVDELNEFKSEEQLQAYFTPISEKKDKELVTYCFIGQTASVVYLAGRILGYNMKLYDGSMQEWSRREELPMEKTDK
jgi:thiosulfate/3-mercaptopyruvate sulfurtransferase